MSDPSRMSDDSGAERLWRELAASEPLGEFDAAETNVFASPPPQLSPHAVGRERAEAARTIASLDLAAAENSSLPPGLRDRLLARGRAQLESSEQATPSRASSPMSRRETLAWISAGTAALAAIGAWLARPAPRDVNPAPAESAAKRRAEFLAARERAIAISQGDAKRLDWTATENAAAVDAVGDIVWDNAEQRGFMLFQGLAANDPSVNQYQLWIFDAEQEHPVDGGVFDVPSDGDTIVEIDAKLRVAKPTLFAVTIEKPGGVVVSDQKRIALVAHWSPPSP